MHVLHLRWWLLCMVCTVGDVVFLIIDRITTPVTFLSSPSRRTHVLLRLLLDLLPRFLGERRESFVSLLSDCLLSVLAVVVVHVVVNVPGEGNNFCHLKKTPTVLVAIR